MQNLKYKFFIVALFPVLLIHGQVATDNPLKTYLDSNVHEAVTVYFKSNCRVGLSIGIVQQGNTYYYNYGAVTKGVEQLPTNNTLFEIASVTKTFTGSLLAKAVNDGKLKVDDDIRIYLTGKYSNLEYKGKFITFRHLSTHQSGLPYSIPDVSDLFKNPNFDSLPAKLIAREKEYDKQRYLKELHDIVLDTIPGSVYFKYSNLGPKLIAFCLENIYRKSYDHLLSDVIFHPLNMNSTGIELSAANRKRLAHGYNPNGLKMPYTLSNAGAAGGLKSSTSDMVRYVRWHLNETDPVIKTAHDLLEGDPLQYARAMGWSVQTTTDGERRLNQSGGSYGFSSQVVLFPDDKTGFVLLANEGCMDSQGELEKLALTVFYYIKRK
jgi:serine-type D-Ala-D-Ala carboxypeptidase/endopeptidase